MGRDYDALLRFIAEREAVPHSFGKQRNDCVAYGAGAIRAQTGRAPLGRLRWTTVRGAARVLKRLGGMEAAVSARLRPIAPAEAMRGDIAGIDDAQFGLRLMVVEGDTLVGPGAHGNKRQPRAAMIKAWSADG